MHLQLFNGAAPPGEFADRANRARNSLKHLNLVDGTTVEMDLEEEATDMLDRVIDNYWRVASALTPAMIHSCSVAARGLNERCVRRCPFFCADWTNFFRASLDDLIQPVPTPSRCSHSRTTPQSLMPPKLPRNTKAMERTCMELAIRQARRCVSERVKVSPKIGAVVAKDGIVLASAYRGELAIGDHAEFTLLECKLKHETLRGSDTVHNPRALHCSWSPQDPVC